MARKLNDALDECLGLLVTGQVTLQECLERYPQHTDDLRPLLQIALRIDRLPRPISSPTAFAAGRQALLARVTAQRRPAPFASRYGPVLRLVAVAALLLLVVGAARLLSGPEATVTHTAVITQARGAIEVMPCLLYTSPSPRDS